MIRAFSILTAFLVLCAFGSITVHSEPVTEFDEAAIRTTEERIQALQASPVANPQTNGIQANISSAIVLLRSGALDSDIATYRSNLAAFPPNDVLGAVLTTLDQATVPIDKRRIRGALRRLLLTELNTYSVLVKARLQSETDPFKVSFLAWLLSDFRVTDLRSVLRPLLNDTRTSTELIGEEKAAGAAPRVCDDAFNAIQIATPEATRLPRIDISTDRRQADTRIQTLKQSIDSQQ